MCDRIEISPDICHGQPRVAGTLSMVQQVQQVQHLMDAGKTVSEITPEDYLPDLTDEDGLVCIA